MALTQMTTTNTHSGLFWCKLLPSIPDDVTKHHILPKIPSWSKWSLRAASRSWRDTISVYQCNSYANAFANRDRTKRRPSIDRDEEEIVAHFKVWYKSLCPPEEFWFAAYRFTTGDYVECTFDITDPSYDVQREYPAPKCCTCNKPLFDDTEEENATETSYNTQVVCMGEFSGEECHEDCIGDLADTLCSVIVDVVLKAYRERLEMRHPAFARPRKEDIMKCVSLWQFWGFYNDCASIDNNQDFWDLTKAY